MTTSINKSAAQTLFDRVMVTWIRPEVDRRVSQGLVTSPFNLTTALIVWDDLKNPKILLNDESDGSILELQVTTKEPTSPGQPISLSAICGLRSIRLIDSLRAYPCLFLMLANRNNYYLLSKKMSRVIKARDFEVLSKPLATEGVKIGPDEYEMHVYLDVTRNHYDYQPTPALKRQTVMRLAETYTDAFRSTVTARVKRHLRLPMLIVQNEVVAQS